MKRTIFLSALALASVSLSAQKYTVSGKAPAGINKIYMQSAESEQTDSVLATNGTFSFSGDAEGQMFAYAYYYPQGEKQRPVVVAVVLDGNVTVDFDTQKASGTPENDGLSAYSTIHEAHVDRMNALQQEYMEWRQKGEIPDSISKRITTAWEEEAKKMASDAIAEADAHPTAVYPAFFFRQVSSQMEREDVVAFAESHPNIMKLSYMSGLNRYIKGWKLQAKGTPITDFVMADTTGVEHHITEFVGTGKYVLVDFWASWCGPCRHEMPNVKALYEKYHDRGFDIVGVSLDQSRDAWTGAIKSLGLPWHHLSDLQGWRCSAAGLYGINAIPATILFGPDGKIVASGVGSEKLGELLEEYLK